MTRAARLNYLVIGVLGGMLAMWACGGTRGSSFAPTGDRAAHAKDQPGPPGTCKQWVMWTQSMGYTPASPKLSPGEEPFAMSGIGDELWLSTRKCTAWN